MKFRANKVGGAFILAMALHLSVAGAADFAVVPDQAGKVLGWGVTQPVADGDGIAMLRDLSVIEKLYRESGINYVRILFGKRDCYNEASKAPEEGKLDALLQPQVQAAAAAGIHYILSFLTPPHSMKYYVTGESHWEMNPDCLRPDREADFCAYVAAILRYLRDKKLPLPSAVCFATLADQPLSFEGAYFYPRQWRRVAGILRRSLNENGFQKVGLIGPDVYALEALPRYFSDGSEAAGAGEEVLSRLSGIALSPSEQLSIGEADRRSVQNLIAGAAKKGIPSWMLSFAPESALTDQDALLATFRRIGRDLITLHCSYWFWHSSYSQDQQAHALMYGTNFSDSPVFQALKELWRDCPPGATVHRVATDTPDFSDDPWDGMDAYGFSAPGNMTVVLINRQNQPHPSVVRGMKAARIRLSIYSGKGVKHALLDRSAGEFSFVLPPMSVAILSRGKYSN